MICQTLPGLPRAARPSGRFAEIMIVVIYKNWRALAAFKRIVQQTFLADLGCPGCLVPPASGSLKQYDSGVRGPAFCRKLHRT